MHDTTTLGPTVEASSTPNHMDQKKEGEVVSTHVLVEQEKVDRLRELSKRTRIAQSEYLREAVDDLLNKYEKKEP
ncbi:MAG: ribbon-helix-helix domain-containing protein [Archangium sp.]|nr:ribbon-helix-helix domain-containing protein [Archangium sp.]